MSVDALSFQGRASHGRKTWLSTLQTRVERERQGIRADRSLPSLQTADHGPEQAGGSGGRAVEQQVRLPGGTFRDVTNRRPNRRCREGANQCQVPPGRRESTNAKSRPAGGTYTAAATQLRSQPPGGGTHTARATARRRTARFRGGCWCWPRWCCWP